MFLSNGTLQPASEIQERVVGDIQANQ